MIRSRARTLTLQAVILALLAPAVAPHGARAAGRGEIPDVVRDVIARTTLGRSRLGISVVDADTGRVLFEQGAGVALKPASNMKILTGAVGLSILGPEHTFETRFLAARRPADGTIQGDLFIRGTGAPGLGGEQWWLMARELRARGVKKVTGDLVGDTSYFDDLDRPAGWPSAAEDAFYNAPVSALSTDYGAITIIVTPTRAGRRPEVVLTPFASFFEVQNQAETGGRGNRLTVGRQFQGGRNVIRVSGTIAENAPPSISYRSVEQPALYALAAFREAAAREGIVIEGTDRIARAPEGGHALFTHVSRPLSELVRIMNKMSNNQTAEILLKAIGAKAFGPPGTTEKGARAVERFLRDRGVDTARLVIADGSGLSHDNRMTATAFTSVLAAVRGDFDVGAEFMASLAIGGVDGTLDGRMNDAPAERRIRAKTGALRDVASLSGYASTREGRLLAFSILANSGQNTNVWELRRDIDRLCSAMVEAKVPAEPGTALGG